MKNWLKKHTISLVGNFFVWVVPLIMLLIMTLDLKEETKTSWVFKISIWAVIIIVIYLLVYYRKLKELVAQQKTIQLAKIGYVRVWVRFIEWVSYILPYVIGLLIAIGVKNNYENVCNQLIMFCSLTMASATIGYIILGIDAKVKDSVE